MGDAPVYYEEKLIGLSKIKNLDILRIGHHGSITSTSETFLDWTQPHVAIISVGGGNRYGHPHPTIVQRLDNRNILTYRTDIHGTIQMNSCKIKA
jgi:competence protein ComEC